MTTVVRMRHKIMGRAVRQVLAGAILALLAYIPALGQTTILPPGQTQFLNNNGDPLAAGKVFFYVPNTSTPKNTWQDAGQITLNTNPVILDAGGRALIYGTGTYRQVVQTSAGVQIYDALTTATDSAVQFFFGGTSTGSANAQSVALSIPSSGYALANKPTIYFNPGFTNTGATTLNVAATGVVNVLKPSFSGLVALTGGEIRAGVLAQVTYDGTQYVLTVDTPYFGISTNLASAGTTDLGTVASHVVQITGTTTITSFGSSASADFPIYMLRFSGVLTLTHNATSLILPGSVNKTTAANDTAVAQYLGGGNWQIISYASASGQAAASTVDIQVFTATGANTWTRPTNVGMVYVIVCGAAGGGAGGHRSAGGAIGTGGGAGGGGYCAQQTFKSADAGASQTVTVGTGGPGGAGATVNGNAGSAGTAGGNTTFGTLLTGFGGGQGSSSTAGGGGGAGGGLQAVGATASGATGGTSELRLGGASYAQCDGATSNTTPLTVSVTCPASAGGGGASSTNGSAPGGLGAGGSGPLSQGPGGGAGGGHSAANAGQAGGAGGRSLGCATAPAGGAIGTNNGGSTAADFNYHSGCGGGGGGGASGTPNSGGNGGVGTSAGGGGGGGSGNAANAGNGGAGGNGFGLIISW